MTSCVARVASSASASASAPPPSPRRRRRLPRAVLAPRASSSSSPASALRDVLSKDGCELMPGVYDALGARLLAANDFQCAFMSGYGVAASRLGDPDVGLADLTAMTDAGTAVCRAAGAMPVVGDGDAGFGGVANVRRTVLAYHAAGFAAVSIEDQIFPKRCAFSDGMRVVSRAEAVARVAAAVDARDEIRARGGDFMIVARTDARLASDGGGGAFEEAMWRCAAFEDLGADVVYFEGPDGEREMEAFNARIATPFTMLAQVEKPGRKLLTPTECANLGYDAVLHGLTLLSASVRGVNAAIEAMKEGNRAVGDELLTPFDALYEAVGFEEHYALEEKFSPAKYAAYEPPPRGR